jgi:hypothetical protein
MSWDKYLSNLDEVETSAYSTGLDIASFFLSDDEILKKLLRDKMPGLTEEQIDMIVDDEEILSKKIDEEEDEIDRIIDKIQSSGFESLTEDEELFLIESGLNIDDSDVDEETRKERRERKKLERKEKRQERKEQLKETKQLYKDKLKEWKDELIDTLKKEIRAAFFIIKEKFQEALQSLTLAVSKTATTLPGTIVMVVAPPWNIPAAITKVLLVVSAYLRVIDCIKIIIPFLYPTRKLTKLVPNAVLSGIGLTLNVSIMNILIGILAPISTLRKIINALFEFLKKLIPANKQKVFRRATRRLVKLGHIPRIGFDDFGPDVSAIPGSSFIPNVGNSSRKDFGTTELSDGAVVPIFANDEDDLDEIRELLEQFNINRNAKPGWGGKWHVDKYREFKLDELEEPFNRKLDLNNIEGSLDSFQREINESIFDINIDDTENENEFEQFIYNITLQDGTVIPNISEEGLEYYKKKYELLFNFDIE